MTEALVALFAAASGVASKVVWDNYVRHLQSIELETWKLRAAQLEKRLLLFYWPIYIRLQRDNLVWSRILARYQDSPDEDQLRLAYQIDQKILLPNHLEIVKIIESNMHLASADTEFHDALMAYLRHVDIYKSIRELEINNKDPIHYGEGFPKQLFGLFEQRLRRYQAEYDELLRRQGLKS